MDLDPQGTDICVKAGKLVISGQGRHFGALVFTGGQAVRVLVIQHLDAVLDTAQQTVNMGKVTRCFFADMTFLRQHGEGIDGTHLA